MKLNPEATLEDYRLAGGGPRKMSGERKSFWRQAIRGLALGFKQPLTQKGRPVECMAREAAGKPCSCGNIYCKGDKP